LEKKEGTHDRKKSNLELESYVTGGGGKEKEENTIYNKKHKRKKNMIQVYTTVAPLSHQSTTHRIL
ncbi:hypothetical protein, partial [Staphylococcus aureus]|uniref:hypothetical protein n=1 Tax=Staphylococcus aureus TaxID=1280 RepID=UPI001A92C60A